MPYHSFVLFLVALAGFIFSAKLTADEQPEVITVTANRQAVALMATPASIAKLDKGTLETVDHQHISQTLQRVAGTWISRGNGQEHLTAIRSPVLTGAGGCGAFFVAEDNISLRAPGFCNANQLFDTNSEQAESIEVIRGPSSTMYGSNAVHGVINILSPDAFLAPAAQLELDAGPHDYLRSKFAVAKQQQQSALLAYGNVTHDGGYKADSGFEQQKFNLVYQTQGEHWHNKSVLAVSNLEQDTAGFIQGFEAYKDDELKRSNPNPEAYRDAKSLRAYSRFIRQNSDGSSLSITPYLRWNSMEFLQHYLPWQSVEENGHRSLGLQTQLSQQFSSFRVLGGLDLDYTQGALQEHQAEPFSLSIPQGEHYDYEVDATIYAPFVQVDWQASDRLSYTAGLRYEHTDYDYRTHLAAGNACESEVSNCRFTRPANEVVTYREWSGNLTARYRLTRQHMLFASYATGYRAPQATELFRLQAGQQTADLDAEQLNAIEVGSRGSWQSLSYDLSLFSMEKNNFIFQDSNRQYVSNGETSHRGIELALHLNLTAGFYLSGNGTLVRHRYENGITLRDQNLQGNEIDTAPEHMSNMRLGWQGENGHSFELEWQHMGNYFLDPQNTAEYAGHNLFNLYTRHAISRNVEVSVRVLNLTDEDYAERADFGFGNYRYFVGEPRSLFASIRWTMD